jgi:two-component system, chemotaxis family, chemotaxis protein CheY
MQLEGLADMTQCLLVDDNPDTRQELSRVFGHLGFDLAESASPGHAIDHCRVHGPDVVVMSQRIEKAAPDFVKRVRRANRAKAPVVLVYMDRPDADSIGRMIMDGAAEYLMKPFDQDLVAFKLKQVGLLR